MGAMRCEGRGRGHQGSAICANSNARIDTAQSNQYPLLSFLILSYPVNHQHVLSKHVCCHCSGPRQRYVPGCVGFRQFPEEAPFESAVANISVLTGSARRRLQYAPYLLIFICFLWRVSRCVPW
jgi:hypothetical protein